MGCNDPRSSQDYLHNKVVKELLKKDVLVVQTGCGAIAAGKLGLLLGEAGLTEVGAGLREVCETVGIPPVLHMGSCVDNTRILTVLTQMVETGGLGDDIDQIPAVGLAPEWMSEKALAIAVYCVASGAYVIFGGASPISGMPDRISDSDAVLKYISEGWEKLYGGKLDLDHLGKNEDRGDVLCLGAEVLMLLRAVDTPGAYFLLSLEVSTMGVGSAGQSSAPM